MELTLNEKHALLARLAARQPRPYDPAHDITIEDMIAQLQSPSRNVAERILKAAVDAGELVAGTAIRKGKQIRVYRPPEARHE